MKWLILLLTLLFAACMPEPELDNGGKKYYLKAYLFAGEKVKQVHVKTVLAYNPVVADSINQIIPEESVVRDAKITLFLDNEPIPLVFDSSILGNYVSDHVVKEGGNYRIQAEIFDTVSGKTITLTAKTVCPRKDPKIRLDTTTFFIDQQLLTDRFWDVYREPEAFSHLVLHFSPTGQYHMLTFSGSGNSIVKMAIPAYKKRVPQQADSMIISPIHFQSYRFYEQYRVVVHHLNKEYADLYVLNGPESDAWLHGNTDLVPEGISNVSNGGGIFTAIASDTLKFYLKKKK